MAGNPSLRLCPNTKNRIAALDRQTCSADTWAAVDAIVLDIEQRLTHDAQWFFSLHWDELLAGPMPVVRVEGEPTEKVFGAFCDETVGIRLTFLREHLASFTGGDVSKWFSTRTNTLSDGVRELLLHQWVERKWIEGLGKRVLPTYSLWHLTREGMKVWGREYPCYEEDLGTRILCTREQYMLSKPEENELETLEMCIMGLIGSQEKQVLERVSGSQLCGLLMKQLEVPLDTAVCIGGQLLATGYLIKANTADDSSDLTSSSEDNSSEDDNSTNNGSNDVEFRPSVFTLYSVAELVMPYVLNRARLHVGPSPDVLRALEVSQTAYGLLQELWNSLQQSTAHSMAPESLPVWKRIKEALYELQGAPLDSLKLVAAFWINVHNSLFLHAWILHRSKFETPETAQGSVTYLIGGREFTLVQMQEELDKCVADRPTLRAAGLLLSNNYRLCLAVVKEEELETAIAQQATEDFMDVELSEENVFRVSRVAQFVFRDWPQAEPAKFLTLVLPYFSSTWHEIVSKMLDNGVVMEVDFNDGREFYMWGGSLEDQQSVVGGGKDLWAAGVMKNHNDARAAVAAVKGESQMLQMTFDMAAEEQQKLKGTFEAQEQHSKVLEVQVKQLKDRYVKLTDNVASSKADLKSTQEMVEKMMSGVTALHESLHQLLDETCGGERHAPLDALYEKAHQLAMTRQSLPNLTESAVESAKVAKASAGERELLRLRDPLSVGSDDGAPWKWIAMEHAKWLQEKCNNFIPTLPGDDAFLSTIRRMHAELLEDPTLREDFFAKRMVECYARFFSTWRERIALLLSEVLVTTSSTPAIVAAGGWFHAENILVGVLRYRQHFPEAREPLERLHESIGIEAGTLAVASSSGRYSEYMGLSKPGRFLLMHETVNCRVGNIVDELEMVLFSDLLLVSSKSDHSTVFHRLEQCVVIEGIESTELEIFNSGLGTRLLMNLKSADKGELWACRLTFACTMTKLKFRHAADHLKRQSQTLRGKTAFDEEIEKEQAKDKKMGKSGKRIKSAGWDKETLLNEFETMK